MRGMSATEESLHGSVTATEESFHGSVTATEESLHGSVTSSAKYQPEMPPRRGLKKTIYSLFHQTKEIHNLLHYN